MGAALAMRDHIALTSQIIIAQESGNVAEASAFELPYMDILRLLGEPDGPRGGALHKRL